MNPLVALKIAEGDLCHTCVRIAACYPKCERLYRNRRHRDS